MASPVLEEAIVMGVGSLVRGRKARIGALCLVAVALAVTGVYAAGGGMQMQGGDDMGVSDAPRRGMAFDTDRLREAETAAAVSNEGSGGSGGADYGLAPRGVLRPNSALPPLGPSVIKTAGLQIGTDEGGLRDAVRSVISIASGSGGFVVSSSVEAEHSRGDVEVRVPAESFEQALEEIKDLGDVEHEAITGRDVSQQFVDLEARLRNLEAQETVLLRLMERSQTVADTIRVQRELQGVQLEIERLRGRLIFLRDQTEMSTIMVGLHEGDSVPSAPNALVRAWRNAVRAALAVVSAVIVAAGAALPILVFGLLAFLVVRWLRPRLSS